MSYIIYTVSYNFTAHATCLLTLTMYKYSELQMYFVTKKLNYKANCKKKIFFYIVLIFVFRKIYPKKFYRGGVATLTLGSRLRQGLTRG
jgi:hypothetical protein